MSIGNWVSPKNARRYVQNSLSHKRRMVLIVLPSVSTGKICDTPISSTSKNILARNVSSAETQRISDTPIPSTGNNTPTTNLLSAETRRISDTPIRSTSDNILAPNVSSTGSSPFDCYLIEEFNEPFEIDSASSPLENHVEENGNISNKKGRFLDLNTVFSNSKFENCNFTFHLS